MFDPTGVFTALITPFHNGEVDYPALRRLVEQQIAGGVQGIVPVGTTGESPTLTTDEHLRVIAETVAAAARLAHSFPGTDNLRRYAARLNLLIWSALLEVPDQALPPLRQYDPRIVRAMERLRTDPDADNSRLARDAGLSRNSFLRLFRAEVGTPPQQFARRERLLQAARQLHFSESSIEEIAQQAGFCDRSHFSRAFRKEFNCGPATYRKLAIRRHDGSRR